jgi:hypothetical protein
MTAAAAAGTCRGVTPEPAAFDPRWQAAAIPSCHWHFHRRLLERYGLVLAPGDFSAMVRDIRCGRAVVVERRAHRRILYAVEVGTARRHVLVLTAGTAVVSAWPPDGRLMAKRRAIEAALRLPQWRLVRPPPDG